MIQSRVVPQEGEEVGDDEAEAAQGDQVGSHAHGEALDDYIGVEWLEDILGNERVVDCRILVLLQVRQVFLSYVDHLGGELAAGECFFGPLGFFPPLGESPMYPLTSEKR